MRTDLLVTLADGNYVNQAKQLFSGAYWNGGWHGDYMLLSCDIPERDLGWFREKGILVRECDALVPGSSARLGHAPLATLSKFRLFTPEFRKWKNVVFLDGDIVVRGSLEALAKVGGFAAVRIYNIHRTTLRGSFRARNRANRYLFEMLERSFDLRRPAFNSGMMAFSTDIITEGDFQNLKNILYIFKDIISISEETVLNLHFYDTWEEISAVYNICPGYEIFLSGCSPDHLKGLISHPYSNLRMGKPWERNSPLYPEWSMNLKRADSIDIASPQPPARAYNQREEAEYGTNLQDLQRDHLYKFYRARMSLIVQNFKVSGRNIFRHHYGTLLNMLGK